LCVRSDRLGIFSCVFLHLGLRVYDLLTFGRRTGFFRSGGSARTWNEELSDTASGI